MFGRSLQWPEASKDDLVRMSQILVVDDKDFEYTPMLESSGYHITRWSTVEDLRRMESGEFHVILLDMRGIGVAESQHEGAGLIEHIKWVNPAQYIIAYSSSVFALDYQRFFELADAKIKKSEDYATFKRHIDEGLRQRFSIEYYLNLANDETAGRLDKRTQRLLERAMMGREQSRLRTRLIAAGMREEEVDRVLTLCSVATNAWILLSHSVG